MTDIKAYVKEKRTQVNAFLESYIQEPFRPGKLHEAVGYSLLAGGKRVRPILCISAYETCGGDGNDIIPQACSIELIHTYSLIHDDLPSMDNDDLRRGKPTNHVVFGEAMAILAGDALLTDAFRIFSRSDTIPPDKLLSGIGRLASAAGIMGMVAGQAQDIISENAAPDEDMLRFIHTHKTAALIQVSVEIGALLSDARDDVISRITDYGKSIGLAFQVVDDILDIVSSTEELGKPSGSDEEKHKMTYPSVYGLKGSKKIAQDLIASAQRAVKSIPGDTKYLSGIADYLIQRTF